MVIPEFKPGDTVAFYVDYNDDPNAAALSEGGFGTLGGFDGDYALIMVPADDDDSKGLAFTFNYGGESFERKSKLIRVRKDKVTDVAFNVPPPSEQEKDLVRQLQELHGLRPTIF